MGRKVGVCKLTGITGPLVKAHLLPRALTPPRKADGLFPNLATVAARRADLIVGMILRLPFEPLVDEPRPAPQKAPLAGFCPKTIAAQCDDY